MEIVNPLKELEINSQISISFNFDILALLYYYYMLLIHF